MKYFNYEEELLKKIAIRRQTNGNSKTHLGVDKAILRRLLTFFRFMLERYKDDVDLWKEYFRFCERLRVTHTLDRMLTRMLQLHGDKPDLWIFASRCAVEGFKKLESGVESGRNWLVKGLE